MKGRLYRFTPAGGKPEHFTHDLRSAVTAAGEEQSETLVSMHVDAIVYTPAGIWERVA